MKVVTIVGARPLHTGQHYDYGMSQIFLMNSACQFQMLI